MSLLLRQACQPLLDAAGLNALHVEVSARSRGLTINTPCGFIATGVAAITFSRQSPYAAEIDYAVVLLEDYIANNITTLKAIMEQKFHIKNLPEIPVKVKGQYSICVPTKYTTGGAVSEYAKANIEYKASPSVTVSCDHNRNIKSITVKDLEGLPIGDLPTALTTQAQYDTFNTLLDEYLYVYKQEEKLSKMVAKLNTCNF